MRPGAAGMVGGQAIDLDAVEPGPEPRRPTTARRPTALRDMHARKTGALIRASVAAGAIMGGANDRAVRVARSYGTEIGLAFQIVDDILDEEGVGGDARQDGRQGSRGRQADLPAFFGLEQSRALAAECHHESATRPSRRPDCSIRGSPDIASWIIERKA